MYLTIRILSSIVEDRRVEIQRSVSLDCIVNTNCHFMNCRFRLDLLVPHRHLLPMALYDEHLGRVEGRVIMAYLQGQKSTIRSLHHQVNFAQK